MRVAIAPFAEDQWGDAPVRLDLVRRWVDAPGLWWSFEHVFQFGPLPTHLGGLLALAFHSEAAARLVPLVCGIAGVGLAAKLATRFGGAQAGLAAGLALALSPVHIQASTTFASESIYLAFALACLLRAVARDPWGMAAFAFLAATTRYDTWIWLPLLGAWWVWVEWPGARWRALVGGALLALGPLSILLANGLDSGDPMRPLHHISTEHVMLARVAQQAHGTWPWRLAQLAWWPGAMIVALTPGFGLAVAAALVGRVSDRLRVARAWVVSREWTALKVAGLGLAPVGVYLAKSLVLGAFWPMARFALGPAVLALGLMPALGRRALTWCLAAALVFDVGLVAFDVEGLAIPDRPNPISPVSRLPKELRAGAAALREVPGAVLDEVATFEDLTMASAAGVERWGAQHPAEGVVPPRIVTIQGGALATALEAGGRAFGATYQRSGQVGRVGWWDRVEAR